MDSNRRLLSFVEIITLQSSCRTNNCLSSTHAYMYTRVLLFPNWVIGLLLLQLSRQFDYRRWTARNDIYTSFGRFPVRRLPAKPLEGLATWPTNHAEANSPNVLPFHPFFPISGRGIAPLFLENHHGKFSTFAKSVRLAMRDTKWCVIEIFVVKANDTRYNTYVKKIGST